MNKVLWQILSCIVFISCMGGCSPPERQHTIEAQTVFGILRLLPIYDHSYPGVQITNLAQVVTGLERDYPYGWHERLKSFGKHAGFAHSIYEKYIFFASGVTSRWTEGEILFMNAKPYPSANREMERIVVSKADGIYHRSVLLEDRVQELFKDAGIAEPSLVVMPPPPPVPPEMEFKQPLFSKIRGRFLEFLLVNGIGGATADAIWYIVLSLPFAAFFLLLLWMWRRPWRH